MQNQDQPLQVPSDEELARITKMADELLHKIDAVPEDEKVYLTSEKFDGPVGTEVLTPRPDAIQEKQ